MFPRTLKRVMSVASRLHPQVAKDFLSRYGIPVTQGYGIIEVGLPIMNLSDALLHPEAIGRPLPSFDTAFLDQEMKPVADGETGELAVRGPGMFAGYLSPQLKRDQVLRDSWFMTGDLAHRDRTGLITMDGRSKSVINVAGHKVFPEEVAAVLDQHPAVLRSRVTTRPHPRLGEIVHAEVQLREANSTAATEDILAFCRRRLSSYKTPASIDLVAEIGMTPSGKVRHG
jgi:long-chain acyl-CoA synthetase